MIAPADRVDDIQGSLNPDVWNPPGAPALVLSYQFEISQPADLPSYIGWTAFVEAQKAMVRAALAEYSELINVTFVETTGSADADISFGRISISGSNLGTFTGYGGYRWNTFGGFKNLDSYVLFDTSFNFNATSNDRSLILHEIGHALTLKHAGTGGGATGPSPYLPISEDNNKYTVMSYVAHPGTHVDSDHLMLYDIAALQARFGANTTTRAGDTVYTGPQGSALCIWDVGGNDTIDASAYGVCSIDLRDGFFSSLGATDNISIAYGVTIENGVGTGGADTLTGNAVANRLEGGGGNDALLGMEGDDFLIGGAGNDTLDGGAGSDIASYAIASSGATVTAGSTSGSWTITSSLGTDTLTGVETVRFTDKDFLATPTPTPTPTATPGNSWHDWNGDGISDILWRDTTSGLIATTASGPGGGTLTYIAVVPPEWVIQTVADFDGDHKADILWRSNTGQVVIWNSGPLGHVDHPTMATTWTIQGSADFNNDGKSDLVWHNSATGEARIWTTGGGGFASTSLGNFAPEWRVESAGDFRNDGYGDILWRNGNTGDMLYFDFTATSIGGVGVGKLDLAFTVETCADFTGDGRDDMLIRHANGDLLVWHENGFSSAGNRSSAWSVSYADDFNGDGLADILWRHTGGEAQLWSATSTAGQFTVAVLGQLPLTIQAF